MDLELQENGDGGDLIKNTNDLSVIYGFENEVYIALFGGNVKEDTPQKRNPLDQDLSFWGNNLLHPNDKSVQYNSKTERALDTIALTSSGRALIEQAVRDDLNYLNAIGTITASVSIVGVDKIEIDVTIQQPASTAQNFTYLWDATKQELIDRAA
jgi:phage gp46-like protein